MMVTMVELSVFVSILGLAAVYVFRHQIASSRRDMYGRIWILISIIPGIALFFHELIDIKVRILFLGCWAWFGVIIWRLRIFCPKCSRLIMEVIRDRHYCPRCGEKI